MSEETKATEAQVEEPKKKNIIQKMKEGMDDKEEQLNALSTMVRLGILVWSGGILTLAYIKLPPVLGIPEQKLDPTFIASVFTGTLATFGVQAAKKNEGGPKPTGGGINSQDIREIKELIIASKLPNNEEPPVKPTIPTNESNL